LAVSPSRATVGHDRLIVAVQLHSKLNFTGFVK
jgi:hypothetical protein